MFSNDLTIKLDTSYEQTRALVIEVLKSSISGQITSLYSNVANLAVQKGIVKNPAEANFLNPTYKLPEKYKTWIEDIIWDLIMEGLVRPGLGDALNPGLPWYHVSEYGKTVLTTQSPQPYDPDGYLNEVRAIPNIDDVIISYLEESLKAFRIHCHLSSVITLGCASEKAILLLIEAYKVAISNPTQQANFAKKTDTLAIKRKHDEFQNLLNAKISPLLPKELKENLDNYLIGLFSIIRSTRNDAGHPSGKEIRREHLYAYLATFPEYLKKVYALIDWLNNNQI
ncbi:hypothetical protein [Synechococcus sp. PCC 6312]|uniref:hypothetical protein n=1 Tax=Synechococcus sp. (strain ATCC 27167 / PCC 6312) TaxID=195253 RepID=UPI00029EDA6D|nr:hypothetical protein [Synechococcus sp. PCC 6312]AFY61450.1 hypothetical protein Syn6312_2335 [Synechococcus sp. PCC 6312]